MNVIDTVPVKGDVVPHVQTAAADIVVSEFHVQVPDDNSSAPVFKKMDCYIIFDRQRILLTEVFDELRRYNVSFQ